MKVRVIFHNSRTSSNQKGEEESCSTIPVHPQSGHSQTEENFFLFFCLLSRWDPAPWYENRKIVKLI